MPAVLQQWIEKSEERNRRIQQLRNEVTEIMELNVMDEEYFSDEKNSLLSYVQKGEKDERKS